MKIKLLVAAAATVLASSAMAQSAFQGFYGQIATGYEGNSVSSLNATGTDSTDPAVSDTWNTSNQNFGGAPLVLGLGYNLSVAPKWVLGLGVDYSALSQKSSTFNTTFQGSSLNGQSLEMSNRFNIFVAPGYEVDKDKLVYLKAGYSGVQQKFNSGSSMTNSSGVTFQGGSSSQTKNLSGYILGVGYKQIITGGVYGFAEYNYMSYSKATYSGVLDSTYSMSASPSTNSYQVLVGVGYKF